MLKVKVNSLSRVQLFVTPWTVAHQAPLSMGFSRQEYWSGLPFLSPGDLPNPGIKPRSPALQVYTLTSEPPGKLFKHVQFSSVQSLSHVWLFANPWTVAHQVPLSMGFSKQEYWSGLPFPSPGNLPDPGIKLMFLLSPASSDRFFTTSATWEAQREYQFSSVAQSCPTLYDPMDCSTPCFPVHHQLPKFTQTHVHWVSDSI